SVVKKAEGPMIVIQLSDPHIVAPGELLYGRVDTADFLARAIAEINRLDPLPDVAVITGDLVDHGDPTEYEHLRTLLAPLAMPVCKIARHSLRSSLAIRGSSASCAAICTARSTAALPARSPAPPRARRTRSALTSPPERRCGSCSNRPATSSMCGARIAASSLTPRCSASGRAPIRYARR